MVKQARVSRQTGCVGQLEHAVRVRHHLQLAPGRGAALCRKLRARSRRTGIDWHFVAPGKAIQNAFVQSFSGSVRDELLNKTLFIDLDDARTKITVWVADYNGDHPHSSLK
jgi:transposase InsO family protein